MDVQHPSTGQVGLRPVQMYGLPWMIQNFTINCTVNFTVLLVFEFRCIYIVVTPEIKISLNLNFYRPSYYSAKCGIAIACRLSVRLSVRL